MSNRALRQATDPVVMVIYKARWCTVAGAQVVSGFRHFRNKQDRSNIPQCCIFSRGSLLPLSLLYRCLLPLLALTGVGSKLHASQVGKLSRSQIK